MNMIVSVCALLQSGIDWLKGWALCQLSLVISVLSPFCWRGCLVILTDDSLSALLEVYWSQVLWAIYTHGAYGENRQPLSYMCVTPNASHTPLRLLMPYEEHGYCEQGDPGG